jgi:hypothetical protein
MLARPPDRVRLWFSEPLEAKFAAVSVWDASGKQIDQQDGLVGPEDPKAMSEASRPWDLVPTPSR